MVLCFKLKRSSINDFVMISRIKVEKSLLVGIPDLANLNFPLRGFDP